MEQALLSIARQAYREPREAADRLLSLGVPRAAIWPAFCAVVVVSVVLGGLSDMIVQPEEAAAISYFMLVAVLGAVFLSFAYSVWKVGVSLEGKGSFEESLLLGAFFQAILLPAQVLQIVLIAVLPGLAQIYSVALLIYGIWINVNFVGALHGFASFGKALGVLVISSFAAAIVLVLAIVVIGRMIGV